MSGQFWNPGEKVEDWTTHLGIDWTRLTDERVTPTFRHDKLKYLIFDHQLGHWKPVHTDTRTKVVDIEAQGAHAQRTAEQQEQFNAIIDQLPKYPLYSVPPPPSLAAPANPAAGAPEFAEVSDVTSSFGAFIDGPTMPSTVRRAIR